MLLGRKLPNLESKLKDELELSLQLLLYFIYEIFTETVFSNFIINFVNKYRTFFHGHLTVRFDPM